MARSELPGWLIPFERYLVTEPRWKLWLRRGIGIAVLIIAGVDIVVAKEAEEAAERGFTNFPSAPFYVLYLILGAVYVVLLLTAGGLLARDPNRVLRRDKRRPVLYFRSFSADRSVFDQWRQFIYSLLFGWNDTAEKALAKAVKPIGPLLAIGRPGEFLRPTGAIRMYVENDNWQEVAAAMVKAAQLVVLRIGSTEGFWWELRHVRAIGEPDKTMLYIPAIERRHYPQIIHQLDHIIGCSLPSLHTHKTPLIAFDKNWSPQISPFAPSRWVRFRRWVLNASTAPELNETLAYLLGRKDIRIRKLPLSAREWLIVTALTLYVAYGGFTAYVKIRDAIEQDEIRNSIIQVITYQSGETRCLLSDNYDCNKSCIEMNNDKMVTYCGCWYGRSSVVQRLCGRGG